MQYAYAVMCSIMHIMQYYAVCSNGLSHPFKYYWLYF